VEGYTVDRGESYDQFLDYNATDRDLVRLGRGSDGESVAALQRRLAGLGFFSGSITGRYDEATIVAVMRYQSAIGTTVNGIAGEALVERIMGEEDAVAEYATLSPGQTGTLVSKYQRALQALGFYGGAIDGVYGDDLAASIRTYCECLGLPATGEVTPAMRLRTYELLEHLDNRFGRGNYAMLLLDDDRTVARSRKDAPIYDESSVSGRRLTTVPDNRSVRLLRTGRRWCVVEYNGVTGYVPTSKLHISRKKQMTAHWGTPVTRLGVADMASGSIGDGVGDLQDRLRALGFYSGSTTALYDDETAGAVRAYQLSVGAQPTGMATARLQRMIAGDDSVTGCSVVLRRGMESPAVSAMQHSLSSLQYYDGSCDGSFDEATAEALRRFTRANGFLESTIATPAVQRAILEQYLDCEEKYGGNNYILHLCREGTAAVFTARSSRDTTSVVFGTDSGAPEGDGNHDYAYRLTQMGLAGGSCEPVESETTELTVELSFEPLDLPDDAPASSRVTSSAM